MIEIVADFSVRSFKIQMYSQQQSYQQPPQYQSYQQQPQYQSYQQQQQPQYNSYQQQPLYQPQPQFSTSVPVAQPLSPKYDVPPSNPPIIVSKPKYQDLWALFLFLVFLAGFAVFAYLGLPYSIRIFNGSRFVSPFGSNGGSSNTTLPISAKDIGVIMGTSIGVGIIFSVTWFILMMK